MQSHEDFLDDFLHKLDELTQTLEEREREGEDLSLAIELVAQLREEVEYQSD